MTPADGKRSLFSAAVRKPGTLVVECSQCRARSRLSYVQFARRCFPVTAWIPWRRHSRLSQCPACERRTWVAVHWFD